MTFSGENGFLVRGGMVFSSVQARTFFRSLSIAARGAEQEGETRLRGPEVLGPLRGLGVRPLVSVIRGLGDPFLEAP